MGCGEKEALSFPCRRYGREYMGQAKATCRKQRVAPVSCLLFLRRQPRHLAPAVLENYPIRRGGLFARKNIGRRNRRMRRSGSRPGPEFEPQITGTILCANRK